MHSKSSSINSINSIDVDLLKSTSGQDKANDGEKETANGDNTGDDQDEDLQVEDNDDDHDDDDDGLYDEGNKTFDGEDDSDHDNMQTSGIGETGSHIVGESTGTLSSKCNYYDIN